MVQENYIFEYMPKRKYANSEEAADAVKKRKLDELIKVGRNGVINPIRQVKLNFEHNSIKVEVGTMDRTRMDTAYIDMRIDVKYPDNEDDLDTLVSECGKSFRNWLYNQNMWDKHNYIYLSDIPENNRTYKAKVKVVTLEFHLHRNTISIFEHMVKNLNGLVDELVETIKNTCIATGMELRARESNNPLFRKTNVQS